MFCFVYKMLFLLPQFFMRVEAVWRNVSDTQLHLQWWCFKLFSQVLTQIRLQGAQGTRLKTALIIYIIVCATYYFFRTTLPGKLVLSSINHQLKKTFWGPQMKSCFLLKFISIFIVGFMKDFIEIRTKKGQRRVFGYFGDFEKIMIISQKSFSLGKYLSCKNVMFLKPSKY